jgi:serine/threonine-protein kinase
MVIVFSIYLAVVVVALLITALIIAGKKIEHPIRFIIIVLAIISLPVFLIYFIWAKTDFAPETRVPKLVGLTVPEAETMADASQIKIEVTQKIFERNIPENQIIAQRPEPGRNVKVGRTVALVVSIGKQKVAVPNLIGKDFPQIKIVLEEMGLEAGEVRYVSSIEYPTNTIMSQQPPPEEEVLTGTSINLVVCQNPEESSAEAAAAGVQEDRDEQIEDQKTE